VTVIAFLALEDATEQDMRTATVKALFVTWLLKHNRIIREIAFQHWRQNVLRHSLCSRFISFRGKIGRSALYGPRTTTEKFDKVEVM